MAAANLVAALRQLSVANLPGKAAWLAALPVLRELLPYEHDGLLWFDEDCQVFDIQMESVEGMAQVPHYLAHYHESREREAMPTFREFMRSGRTYEIPSLRPGFHDSGYYQEVVRPLDVRHVMRVAFRQQGRPVAAGLLGRTGGAFGERELKRFLSLTPLVNHLLLAVGDAAVGAEPMAGDELLVADEQGRIHYASAAARFMLCRASGRGVSATALGEPLSDWLRPILREIGQRVNRLERGRESAEPALVLARPDGRFILRGYRLHGPGGVLLAVRIEHRIPLLVRLYRAGRLQTLPPREQQMVPLLLRGKSTPDIAATLGLSPATVAAYLRNLYRRLDIDRREQLLAALLRDRHGPAAC